MNAILIALGALVALSLVRPLLVMVIGRLLAGAIGRHALDQQSDTIRLVPAGAQPWRDPGPAGRAATELGAAGFEDAGTWKVQEMPGLVIRLMANAADGFYAALYEHPRAGHWVDLVTLYSDGASATFSSNPPTGLEPRPHHRMENVPGASAGELLAKARAARPHRGTAPHRADRAAAEFTRAYAESMAWRRQHGVSGREVAQVIQNRKAA